MGKVSKWFRGILSLKKPDSSSSTPTTTTSVPKPPKEKRRWSFVNSHREIDNLPANTTAKTGIPKKDNHTIAGVTSPASGLRFHNGGGGCVQSTAESTANREEIAAVKIQAAFRGCLARRALRALKGLVKLQALVRGQVERKRVAEQLQKIHLRTQTQVRVGRLRSSLISKSSNVNFHGPATPDKVENPIRSRSMKYDQSSTLKRDNSKSYAHISGNKEKCWKTTDSWMYEKSWNRQRSLVGKYVDEDERNVTILEMDSDEKGIFAPKRRARNLFHTTNLALVSDPYSHTLTPTKNSTIHHSGPIIHRKIHQSSSPPEGHEDEETPFCTANNSPQFFSGSSSSKRSPFTPTKSDGSRSYASAYSDRPNYMAYTESSKAKVRSVSAPKQRTTRYERSGSANKYSLNGFGGSTLAAQRASALHASLTSKAYPDSGRLDKFGLPMSYRN